MNWISFQELLIIHEIVIEETGGSHGIVNHGGIEAALARPFITVQAADVFPTMIEKVAVLIHSIISYHPFADGNKRTALVAANLCLRMNGKRIRPSDAVEPFFWAIAREERSIEEITKWLDRHIEPWE